MVPPEPGLTRRLWLALLLRCPRCREAPIFERGFDMFDRCPNCDLCLNREPGYYVGGMEVNAMVTTALAIVVGILTDSIGAACALAVLFPVAFYRHARSFWICMDRFFDPQDHWWEPRE